MGFGGMKKGFLFSSNKRSTVSETAKSTKVMPADCDQKAETESTALITAKKDSIESQHRFDEVQQAMQVSGAFAMNKGNLIVLVGFLFLCILGGITVLRCNLLQM